MSGGWVRLVPQPCDERGGGAAGKHRDNSRIHFLLGANGLKAFLECAMGEFTKVMLILRLGKSRDHTV